MTLGTTNAIGRKARDFALKGIDGKTYSLSHVRGPKGTLVVFICNHCPYVKASIDRVVAEAALGEIGIGTIAIMPNDAESYPEDSFDNMKAFAAKHGFTFPYVIDTSQELARAYKPNEYVPTGCPGGRAPHLWLDDGYSLYDMFGFEFTLLRLGAKPPDATPLRAAAQAKRLPLKILDINTDEARDLYGADLALVRPDQIVAWRGNVVADAASALRQTSGHLTTWTQ
ncbi:MAG: redoxin domain-containing protein [Xanthobacteraceae bacterium]